MQTRSPLQRTNNFPVGGQKKGIIVNDDSSFEVYFGPTPPIGKKQLGTNRTLKKAGLYAFAYTDRCSLDLISRGNRVKADVVK